MIIDQIGILSGLYQYCDIAYIGGGFGISYEGRKVSITPPGEVRVGFEGYMKILNDAIEKAFGTKIDGLVLFNRVPHYDRMDEIIMDGKVIGNLKYDIEKREFKISLRMDGAYLLNDSISKGWVVADKGAVEPILKGRNLMVPGVREYAENIEKGDEIIVRDPQGKAFGVGIAKMGSDELKTQTRGVAVKIRYSGYGEWEKRKQGEIEDVLEANEEYLQNLEKRAVEFIKDVKKKYSLPIAVSFSGGKDSLVVLLLALESGLEFSTFFLDTGIELPETVDYVKKIEKEYGLKIDKIDAGNAFFESLEHFGPPGRDYRWCCKVCKLGPTTRYIIEKYPSGLLTLIGQRRYESADRMRKGSVWENEWVPNQISASPIQNWTSLEVWLYILWKKAPINPWYRRGLTRIGCYLCPSSDLADFAIVREYFKGIEKWFEYLKKYARAKGIPEVWSESSWRWKNPPKWAGGIKWRRDKLEIRFEGDEWEEAIFSKDVDFEAIQNLLFALPEGSWRIKENKVEVISSFTKEARSLIIRSQECIGCGICLGRCPVNALYFENGKIRIIETKCIHCLDCLGNCPAEEF